ncbi:MAG: hemerythrin domain-containing protein [Candidatus Electrothrix sp. GW3-4]|uniref:hemerythrin domain-containing protein n=1 Tax=Candidatus Electrothrix sp. GW3-4 TaxID=3126740 RepID=UPI0030D0C3E2
MDKLSREVFEHGKVLEELYFFDNYTKVFSRVSCEDYLEKINTFLDEFVIEHFEFEEKEIFPFILEKCNRYYEEKMIQELRDEHLIILEHVAEFKAQIKPLTSRLNSEIFCKILLLSQPLRREIMSHARKEDEQLLPAIKKYLVSFNCSNSELI